jgi:tetratricopeptide (TPR) repeat protein
LSDRITRRELRAHRLVGQFEASEEAYQRSLAIRERKDDLPGQAATLVELGSLYGTWGRLEESAAFFKLAVESRVASQDLAGEGKARSGLAVTLMKLQRYDEARAELQRAAECAEPYGHASEPWKTWAQLEELERATSHIQGAQAARNQAIATYLDYRRDGGVSQSHLSFLFSFVSQAVQQNTQDEVVRDFDNLLHPDYPPTVRALVRQLQSIVGGSRDPGLAEDLELDYTDAAELRLLLEALDQAHADQQE